MFGQIQPDVVYRAMKKDDQDKPVLGPNPRMLGVRDPTDITPNAQGDVTSDESGLSVSPPPPTNLPKHRRPQSLGGTGKDPVFKIDLSSIRKLDLVFIPDSQNPSHGFLAPAHQMTYRKYEDCISRTKDFWSLVFP